MLFFYHVGGEKFESDMVYLFRFGLVHEKGSRGTENLHGDVAGLFDGYSAGGGQLTGYILQQFAGIAGLSAQRQRKADACEQA